MIDRARNLGIAGLLLMPRRALACTLVLAGSLLLGATAEPREVTRGFAGEADREVVRLLEAGNAESVARLLAYPDTDSATELAADTLAVEKGLQLLLDVFGDIASASPTKHDIEFYEVAVGGGPRPFWWLQDGVVRPSRHYAYEATFNRYGRGYLPDLHGRPRGFGEGCLDPLCPSNEGRTVACANLAGFSGPARPLRSTA